jgi:hypothetical protein
MEFEIGRLGDSDDDEEKTDYYDNPDSGNSWLLSKGYFLVFPYFFKDN